MDKAISDAIATLIEKGAIKFPHDPDSIAAQVQESGSTIVNIGFKGQNFHFEDGKLCEQPTH